MTEATQSIPIDTTMNRQRPGTIRIGKKTRDDITSENADKNAYPGVMDGK
jgi:hypothetical protein